MKPRPRLPRGLQKIIVMALLVAALLLAIMNARAGSPEPAATGQERATEFWPRPG